MVILLLLLSLSSSADEPLRDALAAFQAPRLDAEGWPVISRLYERKPEHSLDPDVDVPQINRGLARAGVEAALYQYVSLGTHRMDPGSRYMLVFKSGRTAAVPFKSQRPWGRDLKIGSFSSILVTENENGVFYVDLASGLEEGGRFDVLGSIERSATGVTFSAKRGRTPQISRSLLASVLTRAGVSTEELAEITAKAEEVADQDYVVTGSGKPRKIRFEVTAQPERP
ncbi:MAG: hypothetical protein HY925_14010 [Elusimicrobia bacterium]|nr:hypothetical protein [Elusimicrobiota bacterium]